MTDKVLVDTSVWVKFLGNHEPYASQLDRLLANREVLSHEFVYGEILAGDVRGRLQFLEEYPRLFRATHLYHSDVVVFVRSRKLHGRGVGWIDLSLLASAVVDKVPFWTADPRLQLLCEEVGVAYHPPG